jgi:DNA-3-methyladenine glycosylase II
MTHLYTGTIDATPPFDFAHTLAFLADFTPTAGEQAIEAETLTKAVLIAGVPLAFTVRASGTPGEPQLAYTLHADMPLDPARVEAARDRIGFFLGLADDLRPFYAIGATDLAFAPVQERLYGYHQAKFLTPFENACWAILTQRNPLAQARRAKGALIARYGGGVAVEGRSYTAFPEANRLAAVAPDELAAIVGHVRRGEYLHAAASAFATVDEGWLRAGPVAEVEGWLRAIKGIGAWSATFILVRGLGRAEVLPLGEERLAAIVARRYLGGATATADAVARCAAPYGPWRGYWAHYLRVAG